jgi:TolB protein
LEARKTATDVVIQTPTSGQAPVDFESVPSGKIVYVCQLSKRSGVNQLCLINADGGDYRLLTPASNADNFFPSVSNDGKSVLFASDRTGRYQIYEFVLESEELIQLTEFSNLHAYAPAVSPSGNLIAFYARESGIDYPQSHNIWVMDRDGKNQIPITDLNGGGWDPAWSPDNQKILFASEIQDAVQLFTINVDGTNLQQVTDLFGLRGRSDWSAKGTLSTYIGTTWDRDIYTFDLEGENLLQLTDGDNNLAPSFSPDGNWITFMSYRDHPRENLGCEIYIVRVDGSDARRLTDNDICDWQPRWGN